MYDNAFEALAQEQRRTLLLDLLESNPQDTGLESGIIEQPPTDAGQRVQIAMYHTHLPKLEDSGYIEWNKHVHEVVTGPRFEEIRPLLKCIGGADKNGQFNK